jgi:hypothetical protein
MNRNTFKTDIFFYAAFFFVCIFVLLQSPLAPFAKGINGVDSSVFIYSAQQILDGQLIYKDIVDHKGPFLYFIQVAALFIFDGKFVGIWIFEVLSLFIASIMMYKTARFFGGRISSFLAVIAAILSLIPVLFGGNFAEEWALPLISIASYIFVAYLKENKPLDIIRLFMLSLTFVLAFMMKANLVAIWAGFGIVLLIKWIVEKKYREFIRNLSFILLFVLLLLLPFFLYFYCKGTLSDAIYLVFKFNLFEYAPRSNISILKICLKILAGGFFLSIVPVIIMIYLFFRDKTIANGGVLSAFIFTALACSIGGSFQHYLIIFIPLLVIPYTYILALIKESIPKAKYACLFIIFILYNLNVTFNQTQYILDNYSGTGEKSCVSYAVPPPTMKILKEVITQNSEPADKILVRGYQTSVYLYSGRRCATRFPYPLEDASLSRKYYVQDAEKALPELIIQGNIVNSRSYHRLDNLLNEKYRLIPTDIEGVEIWKLRDDM